MLTITGYKEYNNNYYHINYLLNYLEQLDFFSNLIIAMYTEI